MSNQQAPTDGSSAQSRPPIFPLGLVDGTSMIGSAAAPLLAGFALTILLLVLPTTITGGQGTPFMRWPEPVLLLLTLSAALLVNAVQAGAHARSNHVTPHEAQMWLGELMSPEAIVNFRNTMEAETRKWVGRTRRLYQAGVVLLLAAIALVLVPPEGVAFSIWRMASITAATSSAGIECVWIVRNAAVTWRARRR